VAHEDLAVKIFFTLMILWLKLIIYILGWRVQSRKNREKILLRFGADLKSAVTSTSRSSDSSYLSLNNVSIILNILNI
jgi:hypothetical protein